MRALSSFAFRAIATSVGAAALVLTLASVSGTHAAKPAHADAMKVAFGGKMGGGSYCPFGGKCS